jgi:uncharacterized protein YjdB
VTWSSSNTAVATVSSTGLVIGVAAGQATIIVGSLLLGAGVLVLVGCGGGGGPIAMSPPAPVALVTVSPTPATVGVGQTVQLAATTKDAAGNL